MLWALKSVVIDRLSITRIAANLGTSWHTVNDAVLTAGRELLINDPTRLDGVRVLGVDEHAVRHEALLFRMEVKAHHRFAVVAAE